MATRGNNMGRPLETDDAIILMLGAPSEYSSMQDRIEGITRLEKLLFLLERETEVGALLDEDVSFSSHHFGPFSAKVYQGVDLLRVAGMLTDSRSLSDAPDETWEANEILGLDEDDPYATRDFALTDRGRRYYAVLITELPEDTEEELRRFKDRFASLPLRQLIRYVYQKYPTFTDKSKIRDQVLS